MRSVSPNNLLALVMPLFRRESGNTRLAIFSSYPDVLVMPTLANTLGIRDKKVETETV
jgi:hypothetical protein